MYLFIIFEIKKEKTKKKKTEFHITKLIDEEIYLYIFFLHHNNY